MKRIKNSRYRYEVNSGEVVTFEITPIGISGLVTAAQNGKIIKNSGSAAAPKFSFKVLNSLHFVMIEFSFTGENSKNARYEIVLRGSKGGLFNDFTPISAKTPIKDPIFRFKRN